MKLKIIYLISITSAFFNMLFFFISFGLGWFHYESLKEMIFKTVPFLIISFASLMLSIIIERKIKASKKYSNVKYIDFNKNKKDDYLHSA